MTQQLLTTHQAADILNLTPRRVQAICKAGKLGQRIGGRYLITRQDLEKFKAKPRPVGRPRKQPQL